MFEISVTVAAVVEHKGKFLMVEERADGGLVFNQPAGHLEPNESLIEAVQRETREETGLAFTPTALLGTYLLSPAANGKHYLRFAFIGTVNHDTTPKPQDSDIIAAHWLSLDQLQRLESQLRSGLCLQNIRDLRAGKSYPLSMLHHCDDEKQLRAELLSNLASQGSAEITTS